MVEALQRLWATLGDRWPEKVQTDSGGEFYNAMVQAFFKKQGVNHFSTHGDPHGSVVEQWNRTLKTNMFRYFKAHNALKYTDVLPALVKTYNYTFHRSIQFSIQCFLKKPNGDLVLFIWYQKRNKSEETAMSSWR